LGRENVVKWLGVLIAIAIGIGAIGWHWTERDQPDVLACEAYVRSKLADPSAYRRENLKRRDTDHLDINSFYKMSGKPASVVGVPELEQAWRIIDEGAARRGDLQLRLLDLTYSRWGGDAPQTQVCAFRLVDGELQGHEALMENAEGSLQKSVETLAILRGGRRPAKPKYPCCL
jgi:hypothetical protein